MLHLKSVPSSRLYSTDLCTTMPSAGSRGSLLAASRALPIAAASEVLLESILKIGSRGQQSVSLCYLCYQYTTATAASSGRDVTAAAFCEVAVFPNKHSYTQL